MNLFIVTDHLFYQQGNNVYDTYCFDRRFFDDYTAVFENVTVISRISQKDQIPPNSFKSNGNGLKFVGVPNLRRIQWFVFASKLFNRHAKSILQDANALVLRVPSELGWFASKYARSIKIPYMIEVIGEPKASWESSGQNIFYKIMGQIQGNRLKELAKHASAATYVNRNHLIDLYPIRRDIEYDFISSIRLNDIDYHAPKKYLVTPSPLQIVQVGRLEARKRTLDLIKAGKLCIEKGLTLHLNIIGDGIDRHKLESMTQKLNLQKHITFHGHVADRKILRELLDSNDLFILSSASEGLPRAMLEAMARGLPVIGTDIPGNDELVRSSERYPLGDVESLSNIIMDVARDNNRLTEMSSHSYSISQNYRDEILSQKRRRIYQILKEQTLQEK